MKNVRALAASILYAVAEEGKSLATLLPRAEQEVNSNDRALLNEIVYGSCRWFHLLQDELSDLVQKRLRKRDRLAEYLLIVGLYQQRFMRIPVHAAINETVSATSELDLKRLSGLVNGVLRNFSRKAEDEYKNHESHPQWMNEKLKANWPDSYSSILEANNQKAPLTLRVNQLKTSQDEYLKLLSEKNIAAEKTEFSTKGITLKIPTDVTTLPGYQEGLFSVQDEAAQLSTQLLDLKPELRVLDACAAPGGKTTAIIEACSGKVDITALDSEQSRIGRIHENLARLDQHATVICDDASKTDNWWDGVGYDRILVDAPCSATGVIRRHPDIKLLRKETDITPLAKVQLSILQALWPLLKPGGRLVYATCSVFPQENTRIIERFINNQDDAADIPIEAKWGIPCNYGRQLLPQINKHDGFYYAILQKSMQTEKEAIK